ncbi:MAG: beta-L-arabinofuranosidase domain-containing protein, partial [Candidatus Heimdallarchaeota archaeon]
MAMLYQENNDPELLKALERTWEHLVQKQMFLTGGIGSLRIVEGFGKDYELD